MNETRRLNVAAAARDGWWHDPEQSEPLRAVEVDNRSAASAPSETTCHPTTKEDNRHDEQTYDFGRPGCRCRGIALGLRRCACTSPHQRLPPPGAWHDVSAWHSQCAGRANWDSPRCNRARNARRQSDHIRRGAHDRRNVRRRFAHAGFCCRGKSDDGSVCRHGKWDDHGSVCGHGELGDRNVRRPALRRWRYGRKRAGRLCRVCDGISAYGLHDGSRLNGGPCWNSAGLDRTGRWRPQSSVRRSESDSLRARDELADASRRHEPARDTVGIRGTEHAQPPEHPDRCPVNRGSPDDVRSACDRPGPGLSSDALTLTK